MCFRIKVATGSERSTEFLEEEDLDAAMKGAKLESIEAIEAATLSIFSSRLMSAWSILAVEPSAAPEVGGPSVECAELLGAC